MSSYLDLCTKETQHYFAHKGFQFDSAQIVALILKHTKATFMATLSISAYILPSHSHKPLGGRRATV